MSQPRQIKISIPEPCHEPWQGMTKVDDLHRHCNSCNKTLTDFSGMSDTELVLWFKHSNGKMCGRFSPAQLNRALTLPAEKPEKKKYWLNALWLIPFAWGSKEAKAQTTAPEIIRGKPPVSVITTNTTVTPDTVAPAAVKTKGPVKITGTVTAMEANLKVHNANVSVSIGSQVIMVQTDSSGNYTLEVPAGPIEDFQVWYWASGYESKMEKISRSQAVNGQVVRNVKFDQFEMMIDGLMIIEHDPVPIPQKETNRDDTSFWQKTRATFSFGKNK